MNDLIAVIDSQVLIANNSDNFLIEGRTALSHSLLGTSRVLAVLFSDHERERNTTRLIVLGRRLIIMCLLFLVFVLSRCLYFLNSSLLILIFFTGLLRWARDCAD